MDFAFGEEHELLRSTTRRFLENRQSLTAVRSVLEDPDPFDRGVWTAGAELGWTAMLIDADHDGGGVTTQPLVDLVVLAEELGRVLYPGPIVPTNVVADALTRSGSDALRKELLPGMARGECVAAWALSGDDGVAVATRDGDGYRLDGVARHVHGASVADVVLVTAASATPGRGDIHLAVPLPAPGVNVRTLRGLDLTRRFGEVVFDGAAVPRSAVLEGDSDAVLARAVDVATVLLCAEAVGAADHLVAATVQYAKDRVQFGRPIGSFQAIKHRLADMLISLEGMRAATHYAALALGDGFDDAVEAVSVAGSFVGDAYPALCGESLQLHGGIGFTWEHDLHLFLRRAKVDQVLYRDPAWHRERLCALAERA